MGKLKAFWCGFPGPCGGANTECWHTARLLRENGVDLTFLPTKGAPLEMRPKLEGIGCKVIEQDMELIDKVPGLKGSVVISMCNSNFSRNANKFRRIGCKIIWVNCMTFLFQEEVSHYAMFGKCYEKYVFQSNWQKKQIEPQLKRFHYKPEQGHLIRGAFCVDEFEFNPKPHKPRETFYVGRLSRAAEDKYSSNLWPIIEAIQHPKAARVMAWNDSVEQKCGKPPSWAQVLGSCEETVQQFLDSLHCMLCVNGGAGENWPRIGLEAMACGVPIVAQGQWGWREMIKHGENGLLAQLKNEFDELAYFCAELAYNEDRRQELIHSAYEWVKDTCDPSKIWPEWEHMIKELSE